MLLGGRVAEELVFQDPTTGASNDLERVTKIARKMVCEYGMSEKLGPMALGEKVDQPFLGRDMGHNADYSEHVASEIDEEIRRLVDEAHQEAWEICSTYRSHLDSMVDLLIEKETIEKEDVERLFADVPKRAARGELPRRLTEEQIAAAVAQRGQQQLPPAAAPADRPAAKQPLRRSGPEPSPA